MRFVVVVVMMMFTQIPWVDSAALAAPVDACTFYKSIWKSRFMGCASPKNRARSCNKKKVVGVAVIRYKGDLVSMYLPDFLIETSTKFGHSLFSDMTPTMGKHLELAKDWQQKRSGGLPEIGSNGGRFEKEQSYFWHARILPVPIGGFNTYPHMKAGAGGSVLPVCYSGISEFFADQWMTGISDSPFAAAWAKIATPICYSTSGIIGQAGIGKAKTAAREAANSAMSEMTGVDIGGFTSGYSCAYPVSPKTGLAMNLKPDSDALNAGKLCMGSLGGLLPRQGLILSEDRYRSSVMAAWKFASLVHDFHPQADAGIEPDDKWQVMYPKSTQPGCFRAGQLEDYPFGPIEGRSVISHKPETGYVYAIWRKRTACLEPGEGALWVNLVKQQHQALQTACGAL